MAGYCCTLIYRKYKNLYFLGIAHATVGVLLLLVVPDSISHHLTVGPGWFRSLRAGPSHQGTGCPRSEHRGFLPIHFFSHNVINLQWFGNVAGPVPSLPPESKMDIQRKDAGRKKAHPDRRHRRGSGGGWSRDHVGLSKLKPAAPGVEMSTLWPDTVKRGPMLRDVRGLGTLVPEDTMLMTATTDGRVQRILIRPGTPVKADSVVMILTSPELENQLLTAEYALKAAEADYDKPEGDAREERCSTCRRRRPRSARTTTRPSCRPTAIPRWPRKTCCRRSTPRFPQVKAQQLGERFQIEQKRLAINADAEKAQLDAQKVKVEQLRANYDLVKNQVDKLKVRAGFDGMLQALPPPMTPVEEGQKVAAGTPLGKVAQPSQV